MRNVFFTPSIVPSDFDQTVYLVLDDFGDLGQVWRETPADQADLESVITDLMSGQYRDPVRVISFNVSNHFASDVSADIAQEMQRRADLNFNDLPSALDHFVARHTSRDRQLALRLI